MNKRAIKYLHHNKEMQISREIYLSPDSKAYELYKEKKIDELVKHLDLCLMASERWKK